LIQTLNDYQDFVNKTMTVKDMRYTYAALGLAGETGEVVEHIKKIVRDENKEASPERIQLLKGELGDVLWYLTRLANELGLTLREIVEGNVEKLLNRRQYGKRGPG
jgi:NTP pyrophosphatase (non-canonical NTP hydrolase)